MVRLPLLDDLETALVSDPELCAGDLLGAAYLHLGECEGHGLFSIVEDELVAVVLNIAVFLVAVLGSVRNVLDAVCKDLAAAYSEYDIGGYDLVGELILCVVNF